MALLPWPSPNQHMVRPTSSCTRCSRRTSNWSARCSKPTISCILMDMTGISCGHVRLARPICMKAWMSIKRSTIFQWVTSWHERTGFVTMWSRCRTSLGSWTSIFFRTLTCCQMNLQTFTRSITTRRISVHKTICGSSSLRQGVRARGLSL